MLISNSTCGRAHVAAVATTTNELWRYKFCSVDEGEERKNYERVTESLRELCALCREERRENDNKRAAFSVT